MYVTVSINLFNKFQLFLNILFERVGAMTSDSMGSDIHFSRPWISLNHYDQKPDLPARSFTLIISYTKDALSPTTWTKSIRMRPATVLRNVLT